MPTMRKSSSTTKAFELLETVASAGTAGASLYDLAAASHVAVSTAHRYAASLLELGVLEKDGGGRYRLVDITMTKDTIDHPDRPSRFAYGATQIEAEVPYTVFKDSPSVDMSVALHNPTDTAKSYEYWTCTTLAPGEEST
jgi:IclR helix-turn-helix domain